MLKLAWIVWGLLGAALAGHGASPAVAQSTLNAIERVEYATLHGGKVAVRIELRHALKQPPAGFTVFHPAARIVLEFPGTTVVTQQRAIQIDSGLLRSVHLVQQDSHTRLVMNLVRAVGYEAVIEGTSLTIVLERGQTGVAGGRIEYFAAAAPGAQSHRIREIAFRSGEQREGRLTVSLSDSGSWIDIREQGRQLMVEFFDTGIAPDRLQRLDVRDFATPVASIATYVVGNRVRILIEPVVPYEYMAYQSGTELVIAVTRAPAGAP